MKISELITEDLIVLSLESTTKPDVISELVHVLYKNEIIADEAYLVNEVMKRENHSSTGIGFGIAIPHVKSSVVAKPTLVFGRSSIGIDYESMDDEKAYIFFLIAVPESGVDLHLRALATLSRKLVDDEFRDALFNAKSKVEIMSLLSSIKGE